MTITPEGRKRLSDPAKARDRTRTGMFLPEKWKNIMNMNYLQRGASASTKELNKWFHVRVVTFGRELTLAEARRLVEKLRPRDVIIPSGPRENFETFESHRYSRRQAKLEGIVDVIPHVESSSDSLVFLAGIYVWGERLINRAKAGYY